jgi:hypothetical protein
MVDSHLSLKEIEQIYSEEHDPTPLTTDWLLPWGTVKRNIINISITPTLSISIKPTNGVFEFSTLYYGDEEKIPQILAPRTCGQLRQLISLLSLKATDINYHEVVHDNQDTLNWLEQFYPVRERMAATKRTVLLLVKDGAGDVNEIWGARINHFSSEIVLEYIGLNNSAVSN